MQHEVNILVNYTGSTVFADQIRKQVHTGGLSSAIRPRWWWSCDVFAKYRRGAAAASPTWHAGEDLWRWSEASWLLCTWRPYLLYHCPLPSNCLQGNLPETSKSTSWWEGVKILIVLSRDSWTGSFYKNEMWPLPFIWRELPFNEAFGSHQRWFIHG